MGLEDETTFYLAMMVGARANGVHRMRLSTFALEDGLRAAQDYLVGNGVKVPKPFAKDYLATCGRYALLKQEFATDGRNDWVGCTLSSPRAAQMYLEEMLDDGQMTHVREAAKTFVEAFNASFDQIAYAQR